MFERFGKNFNRYNSQICFRFVNDRLKMSYSVKLYFIAIFNKRKATWWTKILDNFPHSSLLYRKEGFARYVFTHTMSTNDRVQIVPRSDFLTQTLMKNLTQICWTFHQCFINSILNLRFLLPFNTFVSFFNFFISFLLSPSGYILP